MTNFEIANKLFPKTTKTVAEFSAAYPPRNLAEGAEVTRFAPSPTGFLHIGSLFTALVSERVAHTSSGIFFLRIEDTDKKREVDNGVQGILDELTRFGITIDEGDNRGGGYGPYLQSNRQDIYLAHAKHLVAQGLAYPCFCTTEELDATRTQQEALKIRPGYYGEWAKHRHISAAEIHEYLSEGKSFVVRMRSDLNQLAPTYKFEDGVKGVVSITENDQDIVLIKSDGLPTYHFAHVIDDHLMGTTSVIRADEWLSSLPIHLQLFRMFEWKAPKYSHISPILKIDNGNRRKLSKRKDPEAAVEYYLKEGYPNEAVVEYLLNIANSDFEDWRKANPRSANEEFKIRLPKFSKSGALFDLDKLLNISKEVISRFNTDQVYTQTLSWAEKYDSEFASRLIADQEYFMKIFAIERGGEKPRKDFGKWSDVKESISFFFDDAFSTSTKEYTADSSTEMELRKAYAERLKNTDLPSSREEWFNDLKVFADSRGYASDMKEYKINPENFKGSISDVAMTLRVALTGRKQTPDLYEMIAVMGIERASIRLQSN